MNYSLFSICFSFVVISTMLVLMPLLGHGIEAKTTYFRNTTGVYDNTIKEGKGGYFSNNTGSFLQLDNGTIINSPAAGLCNIMSDVYRSQFPTQCGEGASPFK